MTSVGEGPGGPTTTLRPKGKFDGVLTRAPDSRASSEGLHPPPPCSCGRGPTELHGQGCLTGVTLGPVPGDGPPPLQVSTVETRGRPPCLHEPRLHLLVFDLVCACRDWGGGGPGGVWSPSATRLGHTDSLAPHGPSVSSCPEIHAGPVVSDSPAPHRLTGPTVGDVDLMSKRILSAEMGSLPQTPVTTVEFVHGRGAIEDRSDDPVGGGDVHGVGGCGVSLRFGAWYVVRRGTTEGGRPEGTRFVGGGRERRRVGRLVLDSVCSITSRNTRPFSPRPPVPVAVWTPAQILRPC